ncbi:MAG: aminotransferase class V-fold PLP-dependent enzyme, partial [Bacteroidetes bacterium]|nr:aminotransferase class V-fold PLP-dependent enzyme [Bacteroidota bacterium]
GLEKIKNLHILADNVKDRLGIISFFVDDIHYNLFVKLLNDRFGIQVRGGCSCAGTYGHYLLHISKIYSNKITNIIDEGDLSLKPGWVRLSIHPVMTDEEIEYLLYAISEITIKSKKWSKDYIYNPKTNEYSIKRHKKQDIEMQMVKKWFSNI